jgi:prepilin-type N-terminal cleavage/methylation domain-containing protein/prepilin-type processing-associated H-X9-DG protein
MNQLPISSPQAPRRQGFTIVELLVVITIIGMLLTMLLPSLSTARYLANKTVSMNNMKQTNMLVLYYAADSNQYVPNTVRQDQGCSYWVNFYIIVYPTNLIYNTIGSTIVPYTTNPNIFMAPNHWDHLKVYQQADPGYFNYFFAYWYQQPAQPLGGFYRLTSYSYLPWLGSLAYPTGPTMRTDGNISGIGYNNICVLNETVGTQSVDSTPDNPFKSVNMVNNVSEGGNVLFGDGSCKWAPRAAYLGTQTDYFQNGPGAIYNYDIIYRH